MSNSARAKQRRSRRAHLDKHGRTLQEQKSYQALAARNDEARRRVQNDLSFLAEAMKEMGAERSVQRRVDAQAGAALPPGRD